MTDNNKNQDKKKIKIITNLITKILIKIQILNSNNNNFLNWIKNNNKIKLTIAPKNKNNNSNLYFF